MFLGEMGALQTVWGWLAKRPTLFSPNSKSRITTTTTYP
jgi:hypothetical protein